jgi:pimeloyl-ACP methyl ester carboxylesterase
VAVAVLNAAAVLSTAGGFPFLRRFRAHWTSLQAGLAASARQGRHVVVDGTGHNIPRDRPDVVADTILTVAAQVRAGLTETEAATGRIQRDRADLPATGRR